MKFDISKSLTGNQIFFIARDTDGIVRIRTESEKDLKKEIEQFNLDEELRKNPKPQKKPLELKDLFKNKLKEEVEAKKEEIKSAPVVEPEIKEEPVQFLQNELKTEVQNNKKVRSESTGKKGFWDKLK